VAGGSGSYTGAQGHARRVDRGRGEVSVRCLVCSVFGIEFAPFPFSGTDPRMRWGGKMLAKRNPRGI